MLPQLTTNRLLLQPISPHDQQFIFEGLSNPSAIPFYGVQYTSFEETAKQMEWYKKSVDENTGGPWKIVDKTTGENLGVVAYYFYKTEHKKAEVGFWLFPQYWNKGFISEALMAVIDYCKNEKGMHRLEAFVEEGNEASGRVLEKSGFAYEGTMIDCEIKNGRYISLKVYGLIL